MEGRDLRATAYVERAYGASGDAYLRGGVELSAALGARSGSELDSSRRWAKERISGYLQGVASRAGKKKEIGRLEGRLHEAVDRAETRDQVIELVGQVTRAVSAYHESGDLATLTHLLEGIAASGR